MSTRAQAETMAALASFGTALAQIAFRPVVLAAIRRHSNSRSAVRGDEDAALAIVAPPRWRAGHIDEAVKLKRFLRAA